MRRAAACAVVAFVAVMFQLMFVDRLSLPGGSVPDLVLVVVVALGLTHGPATGMLAGFFAGLDLDLAPPAGHLIGESALMFCLLGYGCGRLTGWLDRSAARLFAVAVLAVATGETLQAAIGVIGDPGVALPAVRHVLPAAVLYDALLCPAALFLVTLARGRSAAPARSALARLRHGWAEHRSGNAVTGQPPARAAGPRTRIRGAAFRSGSALRGGPHPGLRARPARPRMSASLSTTPRIDAGSRRMPARPVRLRLHAHPMAGHQVPGWPPGRSALRRGRVNRGGEFR